MVILPSKIFLNYLGMLLYLKRRQSNSGKVGELKIELRSSLIFFLFKTSISTNKLANNSIFPFTLCYFLCYFEMKWRRLVMLRTTSSGRSEISVSLADLWAKNTIYWMSSMLIKSTMGTVIYFKMLLKIHPPLINSFN